MQPAAAWQADTLAVFVKVIFLFGLRRPRAALVKGAHGKHNMTMGVAAVGVVKLFSVYRSSMTDPLFYVRLFGHVLGHGGWNHFINNMLLFLVIAPPLEERYGSRTLLSGILMTALVSGILQCVLFPTSALLGASGIVFMLIMLSSLAGSKNGGIPITFILVGVLYLSQQVYSILFIQDSVANFMHIVGGICGTAFGFAVRKR